MKRPGDPEIDNLNAPHGCDESNGAVRAFLVHLLTSRHRIRRGGWLFLEEKATRRHQPCKDLNRKRCSTNGHYACSFAIVEFPILLLSSTCMQRAVAILLVAVFGSFVGAPLLAASPDPYGNLPACCQRNGKHHCMMRMDTAHDADGSGQPILASKQTCPFFPRTILPNTTQGHLFVPLPASLPSATGSHDPSATVQAEVLYHIAFDRSRQKRGPPASQLP